MKNQYLKKGKSYFFVKGLSFKFYVDLFSQIKLKPYRCQVWCATLSKKSEKYTEINYFNN